MVSSGHFAANACSAALREPGVPLVPDGGFFQEPVKSLAPFALPAAVAAQIDHQRYRLRRPDRRFGDAGPTQGQIADQRGLAGTRIDARR